MESRRGWGRRKGVRKAKGDAEENKEKCHETQTAQDDALAMWKSKSIILSAIFPCCCCFPPLASSSLACCYWMSAWLWLVVYDFLFDCCCALSLKNHQKCCTHASSTTPQQQNWCVCNKYFSSSQVSFFSSWCRSHLREFIARNFKATTKCLKIKIKWKYHN